MKKDQARKLLKDVFRELRSLGYMARMNFLCCQSCAGYQICEDTSKLINSGRKKKEDIKGFVYFHRQDNEGWEAGQGMFLSYGILYTAEHGDIGVDEKGTGELICKLLKQRGIPHEWNGNVGERIYIAHDESLLG